MQLSLFSTCGLILITAIAAQENHSMSSLKLRMNQRGIDFIKDVALNTVERDAVPLQLSSLSTTKILASGQIGTTFFTAGADFALTGQVLERLSFRNAEMLPNPPQSLFLNASMVDGMISGEHNVNISLNKIVTRQHAGFFEATFQSGIFVSLSLGQSENQFLTGITAPQCVTQIYSMNVATRVADIGDSNFALQDVIAEDLISLLQTELCSTLIEASLGIFNKFIGGVRADIPVFSGVGLDLSLVGSPVASNSYFDVNFDGKCYLLDQPDMTLPYEREALPEPTSSTAMGQILIGNYVLQTCLHSLFASGVFSITVDLDMLDIALPFKLDSTFLGRIIPSLLNLAGPNRPIRIRTAASKPPTISIQNSVISMTGVFDIIVAVINDSQEDRPSVDAFTLQADLSASGRISVVNATISGSIDDLDLDLSTKSSNIGPINIGIVRLFIGGALPGTLLPAINQLLGNGISIPSGLGFNLYDVEFSFLNGALELRGDIGVKRPPSPLDITSILSSVLAL